MKSTRIIIITLLAVSSLTINAEKKTDDFMRGREFLDKNMFAYSASIYREVCIAEDTGDCWNHLGVAYMGQSDYKTAREMFARALAKSRESRYFSNLGLAYYYLNDRPNAKKMYDEAIRLDSHNYSARINSAILEIKNGNYAHGEKLLKKILTEQKGLFYAHLHLGILYYNQKKFHDALKELSTGISFSQKNYHLYLYRAFTCYKLGDLSSAELDLARVDMLNPNNRRSQLLRTMIQNRRRYSR